MPVKQSTSFRVQAAQMQTLPGLPLNNLAKMLELLKAAQKDKTDVLVFPEMAIPGCFTGDAWERESFLRDCESCADELRHATADGGTAVIFGNVAVDWSVKNNMGGVRRYNACFAAAKGRRIEPEGGPYPFVAKPTQPSGPSVFEDASFRDATMPACERNMAIADAINPFKIGRALLGCFFAGAEQGPAENNPAPGILAEKGIELAICMAASPFIFRNSKHRLDTLAETARKHATPLLFANNIGITNNGKSVFSFDGASSFFDSNGDLRQTAPRFKETLLTAELGRPPAARPGKQKTNSDADFAELFEALSFGARAFMEQSGITRVVVGASGGIDSAAVAALFASLLKPSNLLLVNMPSRHNAKTTIKLARELSAQLGCFYTETPIEESVALTSRQLDGLALQSADAELKETLRLSAFMLENIQARDRSSRLLAAFASAFGGVFTCNSNKAEAAIGYSTLYGDLCGFLAPLADLWKGEVYALAEYMNRRIFGKPVIPTECFSLTPSAELSPAQNVDENKGDPLFYPYHDRLFASWLEFEQRATPEDNLRWYQEGELERKLGFEGRVADIFPTPAEFIADLERWWALCQGASAIKRAQAPPIMAIKRAAIKPSFACPIQPAWTSRHYRNLKQTILAQTGSPNSRYRF